MGKLELKHLACYLPYGLKIDTSELGNGYNIMTMCNKSGLSNISIADVMDEHPYTKPILRPLSDLTKEIKVNGGKFVPIDKINNYGKTKDLYPKTYGICDREINVDLTTHGGGCWEGGIEDGIDTFQFYELYDKLFEWHFDVFGLIDKGLAIDFNTL